VVYRLPDRVRDVIGARGGGVSGFSEGPEYLFGGDGGIVLIPREVEEGGRSGFGGEEVVKESFSYLGRVGGVRHTGRLSLPLVNKDL